MISGSLSMWHGASSGCRWRNGFQYEVQLQIQGDSGGICSTLGNDSMCDSKQKSSYEHGSDFEWLPRLW